MHKIGLRGKIFVLSGENWFLSSKTIDEFNDSVMLRWEQAAISIIERIFKKDKIDKSRKSKTEKAKNKRINEVRKKKILAKTSKLRKAFLLSGTAQWRLISPFDAVESL